MPCHDPSAGEMRAMERVENLQKFGLEASDEDVARAVACQALQKLDDAGLMKGLPGYVRLWWRDHKRKDAIRARERKQEARRAAVRKSALSKLNRAEREALNLKD